MIIVFDQLDLGRAAFELEAAARIDFMRPQSERREVTAAPGAGPARAYDTDYDLASARAECMNGAAAAAEARNSRRLTASSLIVFNAGVDLRILAPNGHPIG